MHLFVVVFTVERLSGERSCLTRAAQDDAIKHKGGLPRGLQTGTATIVFFLTEQPDDDAVRWVDRSPIHRYAALRFPVLVDVADNEVVYWDGRWFRGQLFRDRILALVRSAVLKPLNRVLNDDGTELTLRRAPGDEDAKMADASRASRKATRREYAVTASVFLIAICVILFAIGGLGGAVTGLVLGGAGVGGAGWLLLR